MATADTDDGRLLTRFERDAAVALATVMGVSFTAGALAGLAGYANPSAYEYQVAAGFVIIGAAVYFGYRGLRRAYRRARGFR